MKIKTSELSGAALDWVVAKCEGRDYMYSVRTGGDYNGNTTHGHTRNYSTDWAQGGPIIEREEIDIDLYTSRKVSSVATLWISRKGQNPPSVGRTPLIAVMRCYVASKLGEEVEVPEELAKST